MESPSEATDETLPATTQMLAGAIAATALVGTHQTSTPHRSPVDSDDVVNFVADPRGTAPTLPDDFFLAWWWSGMARNLTGLILT